MRTNPDLPVVTIDVAAAIAAALAPLAQRILTLESSGHGRAGPQSQDLPAFLTRGQPPLGSPAVQAPAIDDVIEAVNSVESALRRSIDQLARQIDEIRNRLDFAPESIEPVDHSQAIATLTDWLRSIEAQSQQAISMAMQAANARAPEPVPEPEPKPLTLEGRRALAIETVKAAGARLRNAALGGTADERDTTRRLGELALNARNGVERGISILTQMQTDDFDRMTRALVESNDAGDLLTVKTRKVEADAIEALQRPGMTHETIAAVERIAVEQMEAL